MQADGYQQNITAVIVDDEEPARSIVREYLARHTDIRILAECSNGFEAVKVITEQNPDLLFLDIQMPKLNGFEVLELLEQPPAVVFVTAYDEFALKAFEVHAVDYLLKPFSQERFDEALRHARTTIDKVSKVSVSEVANTALAAGTPLQRVALRNGTQVHLLPVEKIEYVEAQDDYVCFVSEGKKHLKKMTMAAIEQQLDPNRFVRIHRSYIVQIDHVLKIEQYAKDSRIAILRNGIRLDVSRSGYARLKRHF